MAKIIKKGDLYFPGEEIKKRAWIKDKSIYKKAAKDPVKFWEDLAQDLKWAKKWEKGFEHQPPSIRAKRAYMAPRSGATSGSYFKWFVNGKLNITENCLDRNLPARKDKPALIWEPEPIKEKARVLSYGELSKEVNKFANGLKKLGVRKGDRVGIYLPVIPEAIIAMLACARIGAVHTVVFSAFSPAALRIRLQDTEAKILITCDGYYRRGEVINLKEDADTGAKETKVEKVIVVKRAGPVRSKTPEASADAQAHRTSNGAGNEIPWQEGRDLWWQELIKNESDKCPAEIMDSEDLLFILYTSGSTGIPKGVVHTCGGYAVQAKATGKFIFDWQEDDIFWSMADLGWITGHTYSCYSPLLNGTTFLIFEGAPDWPSPDRWCQIIDKYKVTIFYTAPTAIRMFEKYGADFLKGHKLDSLRILGSVGEVFDEAAWQWYFKEVGKGKCPIVDTWWQTESGGILISSLPGIGPFRPAFIGLPFPGTKFDILDAQGKSLPLGKEGNLVMLPPFAPGLLRGIYKNPQKYLETYWNQYNKDIYSTSDAAFRDENGLIRIVGRVDDVIKIAGHRFTIGELENAISLHPDIVECAVVGKKDEIKGEVPIAFAVSKKTEKSTEQIKKEVIEQVRKQIGPIALPKEVYLVDDLPKTRSGKIMRRILKRLFTGEELGDLSTLANPQTVEAIKSLVENLEPKANKFS